MKRIFSFLLATISCNVSEAQNVGIGTTTPASRLHLVGNLLQENGTVTLNNPASIIQFQNMGVNKTFMQLTGDNLRLGTNSSNQLGKTIFRMAGQDRVFIDSTGNTQILGLQDASLSSHGYLTLGSITGNNLIMDNNEIMARNNGNADNLILQNEGGNVGIGVANPVAKLHISGDVIVANTGASLQLRDDGNTNKGFLQLSGNNVRLGTNSGNATGNLVLRMNGNDRVTINPSGDIDLEGKITRSAATGGVNLLPSCFGKVDADGTILGGSGNFGVVKTGTGYYQLTSSVFSNNTTIIVTINRGAGSSRPSIITAEYNSVFSFQFYLIEIKDLAGLEYNSNFSFIAY